MKTFAKQCIYYIVHMQQWISMKNYIVVPGPGLFWTWRTVVPNCKTPPKIKFQKIVKLTDHTSACNDLTNFECKAQATGNGRYVNLHNLTWKNWWKHFGWTYFWWVLAILNHCVPQSGLQGCNNLGSRACGSRKKIEYNEISSFIGILQSGGII